MLNLTKLLVQVNNMPDYPVKKFVVASYDEEGKKLWYYGTWDDKDKADEAAQELPIGIVLENAE